MGVGGGVGGKMVIANIGNMYLEEMSSLHNGFLEVLTGLGLVGFLIGCYMLVVASFRSWSAWDAHPEYAGNVRVDHSCLDDHDHVHRPFGVDGI